MLKGTSLIFAKDYLNGCHVEKGQCSFHICQWAEMEAIMTQF